MIQHLNASSGGETELELATFFIGNSLIGIDIKQVQEINRNLQLTRVPQASEEVRGVVNLRGDVVTVLDLRVIFGLERSEIGRDCRNIIVTDHDERIGLLVDRIADVVKITSDQIDNAPANLKGVSGRFFRGVHQLEHDLLLILDTERVLATSEESAAAA